MDNINQLLLQAKKAYDAGDWSLVIQYLQQLILDKNATTSEIAQNQEHLLELALSILEIGDFQQRWEIVKVLTSLGNIAIAPLIDILGDEDAEEELRWYAARTLGEFQHPDVIAALVELLRTVESEELQQMAATALGKMGTTAIAALSPLLAEENTRLLAVLTLSYIRHTEIIPPLLSVVQDSQPAVRTTTIEALSSFHDQRVPFVLVNALDDQVASVRRAAILGLGFHPEVCQALDLEKKLQSHLHDSNPEVASAAIVALSRIGGDDAAQYLFEMLIAPETPLQLKIECIRALSWLETALALEYLQLAFNYMTSEDITSQTICQEIVTVLGRVQKSELTKLAAEILLKILESKHPACEIGNIKSAIALSLGKLGNMEAMEPLILLLADQDALVRLHAIAALKNLALERAHEKLQELAQSTTLTADLRQGVAIALAEW